MQIWTGVWQFKERKLGETTVLIETVYEMFDKITPVVGSQRWDFTVYFLVTSKEEMVSRNG